MISCTRHFAMKCVGLFITLEYLIVTAQMKTSKNVAANLPNKVYLPENMEKGYTVFTVKENINPIDPDNILTVTQFYPAATKSVFQYNVTSKEVSLINGNLLNFESLNKSYLILFQERNVPSKVYPLLIEIIDVPEPSDFKLEKTTDNGCCDNVRRLFWMVPVSSALEFILILLGITILFCCVPKKGKQTIVKPFGK